MQVQSVAIGWQVYDMEKTALSLGLVGLCQFAPMFLLTLPAGDISDRYDQRKVYAWAARLQSLCSLLFVALTLFAVREAYAFYAVLVLFGAARGFAAPPPTCETVMCSRSFSSILSPIPFTSRNSSTERNGVASRYATIARAFDSPIPGSAARSATEAVFRSTVEATSACAIPADAPASATASTHRAAADFARRHPPLPAPFPLPSSISVPLRRPAACAWLRRTRRRTPETSFPFRRGAVGSRSRGDSAREECASMARRESMHRGALRARLR